MENKENTQPKFTPGPWSIEKSEYPDGAGYYYINAKDKNIGGDVIVFQKINNMGNAHLIAVAPEMYELLERLWQLGEKAKTFPMLALEKTLLDIIEEARRILAKARGEGSGND